MYLIIGHLWSKNATHFTKSLVLRSDYSGPFNVRMVGSLMTLYYKFTADSETILAKFWQEYI